MVVFKIKALNYKHYKTRSFKQKYIIQHNHMFHESFSNLIDKIY